MSVPTVQWVPIVQMTLGTWRTQPRLISTDEEIENQLGDLLSWSPENLDAQNVQEIHLLLVAWQKLFLKLRRSRPSVVSPDGPHVV